MSDNGPKDSPLQDKPQSNSARNLFGHKGGGTPWEEPAPLSEPSKSDDDTLESHPTSSAPYPRDAQYTPRPEPMEEQSQSSILAEVDDDGELTNLHPNYKLLMRVGAVIWALVLMVVAASVEAVLRSEVGLPMGVIMIPALLIALFIVIRIPAARYGARGFQISCDRLRVVRGIMWHSDTVVPFGRVQHIDVDQGPIERAFNIATLTLHTAGSHNASVRLPGLGHELAVEMREEIRAHIKRESM